MAARYETGIVRPESTTRIGVHCFDAPLMQLAQSGCIVPKLWRQKCTQPIVWSSFERACSAADAFCLRPPVGLIPVVGLRLLGRNLIGPGCIGRLPNRAADFTASEFQCLRCVLCAQIVCLPTSINYLLGLEFNVPVLFKLSSHFHISSRIPCELLWCTVAPLLLQIIV